MYVNKFLIVTPKEHKDGVLHERARSCIYTERHNMSYWLCRAGSLTTGPNCGCPGFFDKQRAASTACFCIHPVCSSERRWVLSADSSTRQTQDSPSELDNNSTPPPGSRLFSLCFSKEHHTSAVATHLDHLLKAASAGSKCAQIKKKKGMALEASRDRGVSND